MVKELRINYVTGIEKVPNWRRAKIETHQSGTLWLDEHNVDDYEDDLKLIYLAMRQNEPLEIRFVVDTGEIDYINHATIDTIPYIQNMREAGDSVAVASMRRPSMLRLRKTHPRFNVLYDRLLQANAGEKDGRKVIFAHIGNDIEDVLPLE